MGTSKIVLVQGLEKVGGCTHRNVNPTEDLPEGVFLLVCDGQ
jgi:hypothetical protein